MRLVELLQQPIDSSETRQLAVRKKALQNLADGMPQASASRMRKRLENPADPLGQFLTFELSPPLRDDVVTRLAAREKAGSRGTDQQQRGTQPASMPQKLDQQRSTSPSSSRLGGVWSFPLGPPIIIGWPGIISPQYYPNGFPPLGIFFRPVLLVPRYQSAQTQRKPPPPPPKPPKPIKPPEKPQDPDKPPRKTISPPAKIGPGILDWLEDLLASSGSTALTVAGLALGFPKLALAAALAAAAAVFEAKGTFARAGEEAAKEMLKWRLENKGLAPRHVFDLNSLRTNFPGLDLISPLESWQVKVFGIDSQADVETLARRYVQAMLRLYDAKDWDRLPARTANALLNSYDDIAGNHAWPCNLTRNSTVDEIKNYLKKTVFAVPEDHAPEVRRRLANVIKHNPKIRELFPELRLGHVAGYDTLTSATQTSFTKQLQAFTFSRVTSIGATIDQLRAMAQVAEDVILGP